MDLTRRRFLLRTSGALGAATLWACGGDARPGGPDATPAPDGPGGLDASACRVSTADALGPYYRPGAPNRMQLADAREPGQRLVLSARVLADDCVTPIAGALVDVWQADATGTYHEPGKTYRLRGQTLTDDDGAFSITTIRPGNYALGDGLWRPAHVHFTFSAPGFISLTTQIYFAGDRFLPPNDGCSTCGSDDPARIVALQPGKGVDLGAFEIVLAAA